ncbi:hypothetical protein AURDEDRAFT_120955 [Auricularia subglabra TFB-10046 SS5]|nr:hypothetical protein AURDEDRAFT_120955 [Auricularia subglabra TFB-10046 SS5]
MSTFAIYLPSPAPETCYISDVVHIDPRAVDANTHDYARLLVRAAEGHALRDPTPADEHGQIGDCGQITNGRFSKYFNIFDPSERFQHLRFERGDKSDTHKDQCSNRNALTSQHSVRVSLGFDADTGLAPVGQPIDISVNAGVTWEKSELAFLQFLGDQRIVETCNPDLHQRILGWLMAHDDDIRVIMGSVQGTLVVLTSVTHSRSWLGGVARQSSSNVGIRSGAGIALVWYSPGSAVAGPIPFPDISYCVIVRAVQSLTRPRFMPHVKLAAIPGVKRLKMIFQQTSSPGAAQTLPVRMSTFFGPAFLRGSGSNNEESAQQTAVTAASSDPLSALMWHALECNPSIFQVVGSWDVVARFLTVSLWCPRKITHPDIPGIRRR